MNVIVLSIGLLCVYCMFASFSISFSLGPSISAQLRKPVCMAPPVVYLVGVVLAHSTSFSLHCLVLNFDVDFGCSPVKPFVRAGLKYGLRS